MGTVVKGLWSGCGCQLIEDIKSSKPEVKASKSDKWLQSCCHLKITWGPIMHKFALKNSKIFWGRTPDPSSRWVTRGVLLVFVHLHVIVLFRLSGETQHPPQSVHLPIDHVATAYDEWIWQHCFQCIYGFGCIYDFGKIAFRECVGGFKILCL